MNETGRYNRGKQKYTEKRKSSKERMRQGKRREIERGRKRSERERDKKEAGAISAACGVSWVKRTSLQTQTDTQATQTFLALPVG